MDTRTQLNTKLKKGDTVMVIAGANKGKTGKILEFFPEVNRVVVDGVGSHVHTKKGGDGKTEKIEEFRAMHVSNVMILDPQDKKKTTRIGIKRDGKKKVRIARRSDKEIA